MLLSQELTGIVEKLEALANDKEFNHIISIADGLQDASERIGKSWSGSCLGYHANVYYCDFCKPPIGAYFSVEWGLKTALGDGTKGNWIEHDPDRVIEEILKEAGQPDLAHMKENATKYRLQIEMLKSEALSILSVYMSGKDDRYVSGLVESIDGIKLSVAAEIARMMMPTCKVFTRDSRAAASNYGVPPHYKILSAALEVKKQKNVVNEVVMVIRRSILHIVRVEHSDATLCRRGSKIFIGHGRSQLWHDLKDFIKERLSLPWDEFNRIPVAGVTNIERLSEMLDAAAVAFVVLTAEDELADGKVQARMNVIHEVGLFQGRLGFTRAIVLLEEGCEEFSNIQGLGQIRFPTKNVSAAFEEIRRVLEREGLLK